MSNAFASCLLISRLTFYESRKWAYMFIFIAGAQTRRYHNRSSSVCKNYSHARHTEETFCPEKSGEDLPCHNQWGAQVRHWKFLIAPLLFNWESSGLLRASLTSLSGKERSVKGFGWHSGLQSIKFTCYNIWGAIFKEQSNKHATLLAIKLISHDICDKVNLSQYFQRVAWSVRMNLI